MKAKKNSISLQTIAVLLVVALILGLAVYSIVDSVKKNSGAALRGTVAVKSEHYTVDNAMTSYFFNTVRVNFMNTYSGYLQAFGLDTSISLKKQNYGKQTWFDYFMKSAVSSVKNYIVLAEGALAEGMSLTEEDMAEIDAAIESLKASAKASGYTFNNYLAAMYGNGVKEQDLRKAFELEQLAVKYNNKLQESYEFNTEDYAKYCEENKDLFYTATYVTYNFDTAEAAQTVLAAAGDFDLMKTLIEEYEINKAKAEATDDKPVDEAVVKEAVEKALTSTNKKADQPYADKTDADKWLFATDRKENDAYVDGTMLYIMLEPVSRKDEMALNIRHILVEKEDDAKEILATWKKDPTEDNFAKLANEKSIDTGSNTNGGLYEKVYRGQMVAEFEDWMFDGDRQVGDAEIVKTKYGYHIMYFPGASELATWQVKADEYLKSDAYEADYEKLEKACPITVDYSVLGKIEG